MLIDSLARIDYETKEPNSFVIYTAPTITSKFISQKNNTSAYFLCNSFIVSLLSVTYYIIRKASLY